MTWHSHTSGRLNERTAKPLAAASRVVTIFMLSQLPLHLPLARIIAGLLSHCRQSTVLPTCSDIGDKIGRCELARVPTILLVLHCFYHANDGLIQAGEFECSCRCRRPASSRLTEDVTEKPLFVCFKYDLRIVLTVAESEACSQAQRSELCCSYCY